MFYSYLGFDILCISYITIVKQNKQHKVTYKNYKNNIQLLSKKNIGFSPKN